jgi:hypothetical protein
MNSEVIVQPQLAQDADKEYLTPADTLSIVSPLSDTLNEPLSSVACQLFNDVACQLFSDTLNEPHCVDQPLPMLSDTIRPLSVVVIQPSLSLCYIF